MKINGLPVVDAHKKVKLHINNNDIRNGDNKDPASCAAARACMRELTGIDEARVHMSRTYLRTGNKWKRYTTSAALRTEIVAFDRGGKFAPGAYMLGPCQPSKKATGKRQGGPDKPSKGAKKHRVRPYHHVAGVRSHGANR